MSKRIILTPDKVSKTLYSKLKKAKSEANHPLIVSIFKDLETRRKCYKLKEFSFNPHATEYIFQGFFRSLTLAGRTRLIPIEEPKQINFVKALVKLANNIGIKDDYDVIMDRLESVNESNLSSGQLVEIIPELVYGYTTQAQPDSLILKLEYFFGTDVIDILDINDVETNTGKARRYQNRAKEHAKLYLKGKTVTKPKKAKATNEVAVDA